MWDEEKWLRWDKIPGWFNRLEAKVLYEEVVNAQGGVMVEIGSFRGKSTVVILDAMNVSSTDKMLICVDNFSGTGQEEAESTEMGRQLGSALLQSTIIDWGLFKRLIGIEPMDSQSWFEMRLTGRAKFSLIFVDGCHPRVAEDVSYAWQLLKPGGILLCHDYDPNSPESKVVKDIDSLGLPGHHCGVSGTSIYKIVKS